MATEIYTSTDKISIKLLRIFIIFRYSFYNYRFSDKEPKYYNLNEKQKNPNHTCSSTHILMTTCKGMKLAAATDVTPPTKRRDEQIVLAKSNYQ